MTMCMYLQVAFLLTSLLLILKYAFFTQNTEKHNSWKNLLFPVCFLFPAAFHYYPLCQQCLLLHYILKRSPQDPCSFLDGWLASPENYNTPYLTKVVLAKGKEKNDSLYRHIARCKQIQDLVWT